MPQVERFGVSMDKSLLASFDRRIRKAGYTNRSEAVRDIVRNYLVEEEWQDEALEVVGTVTLVYNHHQRELDHALNDLQHQFHDAITCATHVHLDEHNCLEVVVIRGSSKDVSAIGERLISTKGVKHGKLVCTTSGKKIV